jgi:organic radical activating enzyme
MASLQCGQTFNNYKFMVDTGEFSACCDAKSFIFDHQQFDTLKGDYFLHRKELLQRKAELLAGQRSAGCVACWYKEDRNIISMRKFFHHEHVPLMPKYSMAENFTKNYASRIEIWNHNLCNFGCFMCNTGDSSTLERIYGDELDVSGGNAQGRLYALRDTQYTPERKQKYFEYMIDFVKQSILNSDCYPQLTLAYLGGEPSLHPELQEQAEHFAPLGRKQNKKELQFDVVTNGSLDETRMQRTMKLYDFYKENGWKTCVMVSQDAVGLQSQVRFLSNTKRIQENWVSFLNNPSIAKCITFTVLSNLNLPYIDNMAQFHLESMEKINRSGFEVDFNFNSLDHPRWLQVEFLPRKYAEAAIARADEIYERLRTRWPWVKGYFLIFKSVAESLPETVTDDAAEFYFSELNRIQKIYNRQYPAFKFADHFPHLLEYAKDYNKTHYL